MPCYHPLFAIKTGNSDRPVKVFGSFENFSKEIDSLPRYIDIGSGEYYEPFKIPCGKCIGCRLDYSREWADRCVMESLEYPEEYNCWVTLTYSDENLRFGDKDNATLVKEDLSSFMKRLRERYSRIYNHQGIRFYGCGEYGDRSGRPHYHVILFNCPLFNKRIIGHTASGFPLYNSDDFDSVWPYGHAVIANFNWDTAAYTARYVLKKLKGPDSCFFYEENGILPEFVLMSRRPGIAYKYYTDNTDKIYKYDEIVLPSIGDKVHVVKPPRFFDLLLKESDPLKLMQIKERRKLLAEESFKTKLSFTDLNEEQFNYVRESAHLAKIKSLNRNL